MKTNRFPIYLAAAILTTATAAPMRAQDDLDSLKGNLATPAPAPATPKPAVQAPATAPAPQSRAAATATAPRPTPAPAPRNDLAHGTFIGAGDLGTLAGKKVGNTYLTGTYKYTGTRQGSRYVFQGGGGLFGGKATTLLIHFPKAPDPKLFQAGYSSKWEAAAPLKIEKVETTTQGVTAYATDVTP